MTTLVVGAAGDVGRGVVTACLRRGWSTIAAGRRQQALYELTQDHAGAELTPVVGSLDTEQDALELGQATDISEVSALVVATSGPWEATPVAECSWDTVAAVFEQQLRPHVNAARVLIPRLPSGSTYLAIGGGMADFIFPGMAPVSMAQAAQRNLLRSWAKENRAMDVTIRELIIASMVAGHSNRQQARTEWLTDTEIGERTASILAAPDEYPGPTLTISSQDPANT